METAVKIIESFLKDYGNESNYMETEGRALSQEETEQIFTDYIKELDYENLISLHFSEKLVAPTSVTHDEKNGKSKVHIRLPVDYREGRIQGVLNHEIGTHFIRKINDRQQKWYGKRDRYDIKGCLITEEGFASLNQLYDAVSIFFVDNS